jgi:hypothetical protein
LLSNSSDYFVIDIGESFANRLEALVPALIIQTEKGIPVSSVCDTLTLKKKEKLTLS